MAALADDIIADIKARLSCIDVAQRLGIRLARQQSKADQRQAHCWNTAGHKNGDRNPSLSLWREGWKCYGCGEKGDVITLWRLKHNCDLRTALDDLAALAGVERAGSKGTWRPRIVTPLAPPQRVVEAITVPPVRAEIGARLWSIVEHTMLTEAACIWLEARGIRPHIAWRAGCRDWSWPCADKVLEVLNNYGPNELAAAGFGTVDVPFERLTPDAQWAVWFHGENKQNAQPWKAFEHALGPDPTRHGLMVPEWHPAHPGGPVSWRLRRFQPWGPRKVEAQPGSALRHLPLGLDDLASAARAGEPYSVIVCEGETDWLSTMDAAARLLERAPDAGRIVALGYCAMSSNWPDLKGLAVTLAGARRVVVGFDRGHGEQPAGLKRARDIRDAIDRAAGQERTNAILKVRLTREGRDLADLHRADELVDWLADKLEV